MQIRIDETTLGKGKEIVAISFKNDKERIEFATQIFSMQPNDGVRLWVSFPDDAMSVQEMEEYTDKVFSEVQECDATEV